MVTIWQFNTAMEHHIFLLGKKPSINWPFYIAMWKLPEGKQDRNKHANKWNHINSSLHIWQTLFGLCLLISLGSCHTLYPWGLRTQKGNITTPPFTQEIKFFVWFIVILWNQITLPWPLPLKSIKPMVIYSMKWFFLVRLVLFDIFVANRKVNLRLLV